MNSIEDPLEASGLSKSATIYRNSEFNYIYVCYHCGCSFTNSLDTLTHVESHFDSKVEAKVNIDNENLVFVDARADNETEINLSTKNVNRLVASSDVNEPDETEYEYAEVEQKYQCSNENGDDTKPDVSDTTKDDRLRQCGLCSRTFNTAMHLILHMIKGHAKRTSLECPQCSQNDWPSESAFLSHLQEHIGANDTTYKAMIYKVQVKIEATVNIEPDKFPPKNYNRKCLRICDICSSTFTTKENLILHMRQQHIEQPKVKQFSFDCDKCNRKIEGKFAFYAHQYGHLTNDDRVNDPANDEDLQRGLKRYLNSSVTCNDTTPIKTYGCSICNQIAVKQLYGAQRHIMQQHIYLMKTTRQKQFPCEYCGALFALISNLRVHRRTHNLEKPYKCPTCGKAFSHSSYMRYHEKIHSGRR